MSGVLPVTAETLQLSADGNQVACHTDYAGEIQVWNPTTRTQAVKINIPKDFRVMTASFSAKLGKLNTVEWHYKEDKSGEAIVRQWDLATGKPDGMWPIPSRRDGASLAAGLRDSTILIYDICRFDPRRAAAARLDQGNLERLWNDLGGDHADKAHQALWALVASPGDAVPFLASKLKLAERVDPATVQKWIADLDNARFDVRRDAARRDGAQHSRHHGVGTHSLHRGTNSARSPGQRGAGGP